MTWYFILLIIILILIVVPLIFMLIYTFNIAKKLYIKFLVRDTNEKWGRECSDTTNEEQVRMYKEGIDFAKDKNFVDVSIKSEGYKLVGKYLDNKSDKCVIIIPGRTESLLYSYYFSIPYYNHGLNILVIDNRCHGESEGKFDTLGIEEYKDILAWSKFVINRFNNKEIILHGICIGAATSIYAAVNKSDINISLLVLDGLYTNFKDIFKNHIIYEKKPVFPVLNEVMFLIKHKSHVDPIKYNPINLIDKIDIPTLFLYSNEDAFVTSEMKNMLYNKCTSNNKMRRDFEHGAHSHIRINNEKEYDETIIDFLLDYNK